MGPFSLWRSHPSFAKEGNTRFSTRYPRLTTRNIQTPVGGHRPPLQPDNVDNRKDDNPHRIDKVPIKRQSIHRFGVFLSYVATDREQQDRRQSNKTNGHVKRM